MQMALKDDLLKVVKQAGGDEPEVTHRFHGDDCDTCQGLYDRLAEKAGAKATG